MLEACHKPGCTRWAPQLCGLDNLQKYDIVSQFAAWLQQAVAASDKKFVAQVASEQASKRKRQLASASASGYVVPGLAVFHFLVVDLFNGYGRRYSVTTL